MKQIVLLLFFFVLSTHAFSQINGDSRYSFGVKAYNYMQMPKMLNQAEGNTYLSTYFNSYIIKFNDNLFSYRLSGNYLNKSTEFFNNCASCELATGKVKDYSFKAGFEKNFTYTTFQPYAAIDFGYRSNKFTGSTSNVNAEKSALADQMNATIPLNAVESSKEGFTITPVIGLKVSPARFISIFVESSLEFYYSYVRQETVTQDASNTSSLTRFQKAEYLVSPVSVGVQFHLGTK
jgi:hypothetical protein